MLNVIPALNQVQRAEEIRARQDAVNREGRALDERAAPGDSSGGRRVPAEQRGPIPAASKDFQVPARDDADVLSLLDRAVRAFSEEEQAPGTGQPRLPLREGANVPFDTLKRASSGEQLFLDVPGAGDDQEPQVPFEVLKRAAATAGGPETAAGVKSPPTEAKAGHPFAAAQLELPWGTEEPGEAAKDATAESALAAEAKPKSVYEPERRSYVDALKADEAARASEAAEERIPLAAFEAPAGGGPPFGREIPFDMSVSRAGSSESGPGGNTSDDIVARMRSEYAAHRYAAEGQRGVRTAADHRQSVAPHVTV